MSSDTEPSDDATPSEPDRTGSASAHPASQEITTGGASTDDAATAATVRDDAATPRYSAARIATAVALPVALVVAVLVVAVLSRQSPAREPLALGPVPAPAASDPACSALLPALPETLGDYGRADVAQPAPPATRAWQQADGGEPIVLRCGLDRPTEFTADAPLQVVNGVNWFEVRDRSPQAASATWYVVDRGTYIAVTMPDSAGPTPLQDISNAITGSVPTRPIDPAPLPR